MKYEKDWARQDSSRRRLEDGLHWLDWLCQIALAGVNLAPIEFIPPVVKTTAKAPTFMPSSLLESLFLMTLSIEAEIQFTV